MSGKRYQPNVKNPAPPAEIRSAAPADFRGHEIGWRFASLDIAGPFGWERCERDILIGIIHGRVKCVESMLWKEILGKHLHAIPVWKLSKLARERLRDIGQGDVEELYCLRIEKRPRLWGVRDRMFFKILWWDPQHQVYPMNIADN